MKSHFQFNFEFERLVLRRGCGLALLAVVGSLLAAGDRGVAVEKPAQASEYSLKAIFLLNFTKFIEWPASAFTNESAPFVVGIAGEDPFSETLEEAFAGQTIGGRGIVLRRYPSGSLSEECHMVFVSRSVKDHQAVVLAGLRGRPILTVGEADQFLEEGGIINFVIAKERVRFEIHAGRAEKAGLRISSKLLGVATRVASGEPEK